MSAGPPSSDSSIESIARRLRRAFCSALVSLRRDDRRRLRAWITPDLARLICTTTLFPFCVEGGDTAPAVVESLLRSAFEALSDQDLERRLVHALERAAAMGPGALQAGPGNGVEDLMQELRAALPSDAELTSLLRDITPNEDDVELLRYLRLADEALDA